MGLFGLGKGIAKVVGGIVTGDGEMIVSGLKKTAINAATTTAQIAAKEGSPVKPCVYPKIIDSL